MQRRFNYTNRIRIRRHDLRIVLRRSGGELFFDADLSSLNKYHLPNDGLVSVEAYRQTMWRRFEFGTVKSVGATDACNISAFVQSEGILFRVKVRSAANSNQLLAEADSIPLTEVARKEVARQPLLSVKPAMLGAEVYKLDYSDEQPLLLVNKDIGHYMDVCKSSAFSALVYPAVFKEILIRLIHQDKHHDLDDDDWKSRWLRFGSLCGAGALPDQPYSSDSEKEWDEWIEDAIAKFSRNIQSKQKFVQYLESAS